MPEVLETVELCSIVAKETVAGLTLLPKRLPAWLFSDAHGTLLFEKITCLPEYYVTRTERDLLMCHAAEIIVLAAGGGRLTLVKLGAGTATKTGILLLEAVRRQKQVVYQPIDVSATSLDIAKRGIEKDLIGIDLQPQVADYTAEQLNIQRATSDRVLLVYLGSSIGNFTPVERRHLLKALIDLHFFECIRAILSQAHCSFGLSQPLGEDCSFACKSAIGIDLRSSVEVGFAPGFRSSFVAVCDGAGAVTFAASPDSTFAGGLSLVELTMHILLILVRKDGKQPLRLHEEKPPRVYTYAKYVPVQQRTLCSYAQSRLSAPYRGARICPRARRSHANESKIPKRNPKAVS
jgi:hypothetical protein